MKKPIVIDGEIGDVSEEAKPMELVLNRKERRKLYAMVSKEKRRAEKKARYAKNS